MHIAWDISAAASQAAADVVTETAPSVYCCMALHLGATAILELKPDGAPQELCQLAGVSVTGFGWCAADQKLVAASAQGSVWIIGRGSGQGQWSVELRLDCSCSNESVSMLQLQREVRHCICKSSRALHHLSMALFAEL